MKLKDRYQTKFGLKSTATLRGYQLKAVNLGVSIPGVALLMDPRLGKTRVDIAISGYHYLNSGLRKWVIVCPAIAKEVWKSEIESTLNVPYQVIIIDGELSSHRSSVQGMSRCQDILNIVIVNFESTWRIKKSLYKLCPDKVTVDESHRIKNNSAKQSRAIQTLGNRAKHRSILTGTLLSTPVDVFSQYKFLDFTIFGTVKAEFLSKYVRTYGYMGYKPRSFKNLDLMHRKINSVAFKLTREEAGGFPDELYQTIYFDLTKPASQHYIEMKKTLTTIVNDQNVTAPIVLTQLLRLQQITGGFLPVQDPNDDLPVNVGIGSDRLSALLDLVWEYPGDTPLVIFARYRYEIKAIKTKLKYRKPGTIVGGMKSSERSEVISNFQSGKLNTCIVQIRAGGIAVNLDRADTAIFYSITHSFIDYEQAKARIIGRSGGSVALINLCAKGTVDEEILESVQNKKEVFDTVMKKILK